MLKCHPRSILVSCIFQRICLFTEGMFTTSFEANHRDVISILPISCFCPRTSQWRMYSLHPCLGLFCQLSFPRNWEDSVMDFPFFLLQLYFGRGLKQKKNPTMECTSSCCKSSLHFMASCDTHRISLVRAMCHLTNDWP